MSIIIVGVGNAEFDGKLSFLPLSVNLAMFSLLYWLRDKALALRSGFNSCFHKGTVSRLSHTSDLRIGTPVATLPGAWHYRVNGETGWPGVSIQ